MIAASTAESTIPAQKGLNKWSVITRNTVSELVPLSGVVKYTLPTIPTHTAAVREITTQVIAMRVAFFNSLEEVIAMKRTKI